MSIDNKTAIATFIRKAFRDVLLLDEQRRLATAWSRQSLIEDAQALDDLRDEFHRAEVENDFSWMFQLCDQFKLWPDFKLTDDQKKYLARCMMKVNVIAIDHILDRVRGNYKPPPDVSHVLDHIDPDDKPETSVESLRGPGRPSSNWEGIRKKLLDMEQNGELPPIKHGWKTKVSRQLVDWAKSDLGQILRMETVRDNSLIQAEFARIEKDAEKL